MGNNRPWHKKNFQVIAILFECHFGIEERVSHQCHRIILDSTRKHLGHVYRLNSRLRNCLGDIMIEDENWKTQYFRRGTSSKNQVCCQFLPFWKTIVPKKVRHNFALDKNEIQEVSCVATSSTSKPCLIYVEVSYSGFKCDKVLWWLSTWRDTPPFIRAWDRVSTSDNISKWMKSLLVSTRKRKE